MSGAGERSCGTCRPDGARVTAHARPLAARHLRVEVRRERGGGWRGGGWGRGEGALEAAVAVAAATVRGEAC